MDLALDIVGDALEIRSGLALPDRPGGHRGLHPAKPLPDLSIAHQGDSPHQGGCHPSRIPHGLCALISTAQGLPRHPEPGGDLPDHPRRLHPVRVPPDRDTGRRPVQPSQASLHAIRERRRPQKEPVEDRRLPRLPDPPVDVLHIGFPASVESLQDLRDPDPLLPAAFRCVSSHAGPGVLFRLLNHARSNGIQVYVPAQLGQVSFFLDQDRLEAPLEEVSHPSAPAVEPLGVRSEEPLPERRQVGPARLEDQVDVVVQQAVGVHLDPEESGQAPEPGQHLLPVRIVEEDLLAVVATMDDVVKRARQIQPQGSRHPATLSGVRYSVNLIPAPHTFPFITFIMYDPKCCSA